jgi:hypothetical protein
MAMISVSDAAMWLHVSTRRVYQMIAEGRFTTVEKEGGSYRISLCCVMSEIDRAVCICRVSDRLCELDEYELEMWEERAAIKESEAGMTRQRAELQAFLEIKRAQAMKKIPK